MADPSPHAPTLPGPQKIIVTIDGSYTADKLAKLLYQIGLRVETILGTKDYSIGFGSTEGN
jgi:hypothetical protein